MGLPRLRETEGLEVLFAGDPAVLVVDLDVDPNIAGISYSETEVVLVRAPGNRSFRFEVLNLRIWLNHDVLGSKSILRFGKEAHKGHLFPEPQDGFTPRSEEHTSEVQSHLNLVCRLLLEKKNTACQS